MHACSCGTRQGAAASAYLGSERLGKQRFAVAGRAVEEQAPCGRAQALEQVCALCREDHHLLQRLVRRMHTAGV